MKNKFLNYLKQMPKYVWVLIFIVAVGIFFRTYNFRDWLEFSPDQARDATLVENYINGKVPLPLVGPQAGNTLFSLGPLYYYFQIVSAKIFGAKPEAMAYPDLLFSIVTIPLFFIFLKKYFSLNISLALTTVMSVSYFAIINSRFASNPNSIPLFSLIFLWGLWEMMREKNKNHLLWPILVGMGMGVGVQQHTILLLGMPVIAFGVFLYILKNKSVNWKSVAIIIFVFLLLNAGQVAYEWKSNGSNMAALLKGIGSKGGNDSDFWEKTGIAGACQVHANMHIISSLQGADTCDSTFKFSHTVRENRHVPKGGLKIVIYFLSTIISLIFSIGGYYLGWRYFKKEKDEEKKKFLILLAAYNVVLFLIFIPAADEIAVRYFIVLFFVPFVLLGFWLKFLKEKFKSRDITVCLGLLSILLLLNIFTTLRTSIRYANGYGSNIESSVLGEIELMEEYIVLNADKSQSGIFIVGEKMYSKRFFKPLSYLAEKQGISLILADNKNKKLPAGTQVFFISKTSDKKYKPGDLINGKTIEKLKIFNNITIYIFRI